MTPRRWAALAAVVVVLLVVAAAVLLVDSDSGDDVPAAPSNDSDAGGSAGDAGSDSADEGAGGDDTAADGQDEEQELGEEAAPPQPEGPKFALGEGPGYFPDPDGLSPDMTAPEYAPVLDGSAQVTDISGDYEWEPRPIGGGGWVRGLEVNGSGALVIARTDVGGAYRFERDQDRWTQLITEDAVDDPNIDDYQVEAVALTDADPARIYLSAGRSVDGSNPGRGRVLTSRDRGESWTTSEQGFEVHGNGRERSGGERISASPVDADEVWIGTTDGLWRSVDGGVTFAPIDSAPRGDSDLEAQRGVEWVEVEADRVYIGVSGAGVYESTDDGVSWRQLWVTSQRPWDAEVDENGILWGIDKQDGFVWRYDPVSGNVERINEVSGSDLRGIALRPDGELIVILTENDVIWRSVDGGDSWDRRRISFSCPGIPWLDSFPFDLFTASSPEFDPLEPDRMWMPQGFAVWSMPDVFSSSPEFVCRTTGIEELVVNDIVVNESDVVVAASWDRPVFHLPPGGEPTAQVGPTDRISGGWDIATTPADPEFMTAVVGDIRFCCEGDGQAYTSVFSEDGGRTWEPLPSYEAGTHPESLRFGSMAINSGDPRNIVWLPSWDGAPHYSRDRGKTWTAVVLPGTEDQIDENGVYTGGSHFQYYLQREVLLADPFVADRFYLFHAENGLLRSDDGGATWEVISPDGLPTGWTIGYFHAQLTAVPDRPGHLLYTPGVVLEGFFPLFESVDYGETWSIVPNTSDVFVVGYGAPIPGSDQATIYMQGAVNEVSGLYRSTDLMESWEFLGSTADGIYRIVHAIAGDPGLPGRVYVGFNGTSIVQGDEQ